MKISSPICSSLHLHDYIDLCLDRKKRKLKLLPWGFFLSFSLCFFFFFFLVFATNEKLQGFSFRSLKELIRVLGVQGFWFSQFPMSTAIRVLYFVVIRSSVVCRPQLGFCCRSFRVSVFEVRVQSVVRN